MKRKRQKTSNQHKISDDIMFMVDAQQKAIMRTTAHLMLKFARSRNKGIYSSLPASFSDFFLTVDIISELIGGTISSDIIEIITSNDIKEDHSVSHNHQFYSLVVAADVWTIIPDIIREIFRTREITRLMELFSYETTDVETSKFLELIFSICRKGYNRSGLCKKTYHGSSKSRKPTPYCVEALLPQCEKKSSCLNNDDKLIKRVILQSEEW